MPTDFFGRVMVVFDRYDMSMLQGTGVSVRIALAGTLADCIAGSIAGIAQTISSGKGDNPIKRAVLWVVKLMLNAYVGFFRGTSTIAQVIFIYFRLLPLPGISMSVWGVVDFILSTSTGAHIAEVVGGKILSIGSDQTEGTRSIGMVHAQTMVYAVLSQVLRNIMPQIGNNLIINVKDNCVFSAIGVAELLCETETVVGAPYMSFETYTTTMIMYLIMTFTCSGILHWWGSRMDGADDFDLTTTDILAHTNGMYRSPDDKGKNKEGA